MNLNCRIVLAAAVFLSLHLLIDNIPLSKAKEHEQGKVTFSRFPDVGGNHASSSNANAKTRCEVVFRRINGEWKFGNKYECIVWPYSRYGSALGRIRKKKKGKSRSRKKATGTGLLDALSGILGICMDQSGNAPHINIWYIIWTILYTAFLAVLQKVVNLWKSRMSARESETGRNTNVSLGVSLANMTEEAPILKEMETQTDSSYNQMTSVTDNKGEPVIGKCKKFHNKESISLESIGTKTKTADVMQQEQNETMCLEGQSKNWQINMFTSKICSDNDDPSESKSDSPGVIYTTDENRVEKKIEGAIYPSLDDFQMNVSHFELFYPKARSAKSKRPRHSGKWILVDDVLIWYGPRVHGSNTVKPDVKNQQEEHPMMNSKEEEESLTTPSVQSRSNNQDVACYQQSSLDNDVIYCAKVDGILGPKCGFEKIPGKEFTSGDTNTNLSKFVRDECQDEEGTIQTVGAVEVEDNVTINEGNLSQVNVAADKEISDFLPRHLGFNTLERKVDYGKDIEMAQGVVQTYVMEVEELGHSPDGAEEKISDGIKDTSADATICSAEENISYEDCIPRLFDVLNNNMEECGKDSEEMKLQDPACLRQKHTGRAISAVDNERNASPLEGEYMSGEVISAPGSQQYKASDSEVFVEKKANDTVWSNISESMFDQQMPSLDEAKSSDERKMAGVNEWKERMLSACDKMVAPTIVCRNDSGIDCADNHDLTTIDKRMECLEDDSKDDSSHDASHLSVTDRRDVASGCNIEYDAVKVVAESNEYTGNDNNVQTEEEIASTNEETTLVDEERDTAYNDECAVSLTTNLHNDEDGESNNQDLQSAKKGQKSESTVPISQGEKTLNEGIVAEDNNGLEESLDDNLLEMFWGEILANYDPQRLMDSFENYHRLQENMKKEDTVAECPGNTTNGLGYLSTETTATTSAGDHLATNTALDSKNLRLSDERQVSLLMDMPLRCGSTSMRRIDPIKAMKFWFL